MKLLLLSLLILIMTGCATAIPLTYEEDCAVRGMKLAGATTGHSVTTSTIIGRHGHARAFSHSRGEGISCVVSEDEKENCKIDKLRAVALPKHEYNRDIRMKKMIIGLGYATLIVPGIVAKLIYDHQRSSAIDESQEIYRTTADKCTLPALSK